MINFDPSVQNFVLNPAQYRLDDSCRTISAALRNPNESRYDQRISLQLLEELSKDPKSKKIISVLRSWEVKDPALYRFFEFFKILKAELRPFELDLALWCEEKIGQDEYQTRVIASRRIRNAFVEKLPALDLSGLNLSTLPNSICKLVNLENFIAANNKISSLPKDFNQLKNLKIVDLEKNEFKEFPEVITQITSIEELNFINNLIEVIPPSIGKMSGLKILLLCTNKISSFPTELNELPNLAKLFLRNNLLTFFPVELCQLKKLTYLHLGNNKITDLPKEISGLTSLKRLQLENNQLIRLPIEILSIKNLGILDVTCNQLEFSESLFEFCKLKTFLLEGNPCHFILTSFQIFKQIHFWTPDLDYNAIRAKYSHLISHPRIQELRTFLSRLVEIKDFTSTATKAGIIDMVVNILNLAANNEIFREKLFDVLYEASSHCGDRVANAFNDICCLHAIYTAYDPLNDREGLKLAKVLIGLERKILLDKFSLKYAIDHKLGDQIEVALYFQIKCKDLLCLPIKIRGMLYPKMAQIKKDEEANIINGAVHQIKAVSSSFDKILEILCKNDHWIQNIKDSNSDEFESINNEAYEQLEKIDNNETLNDGQKMEAYHQIAKSKDQAEDEKVVSLTSNWLEKQFNSLTQLLQ